MNYNIEVIKSVWRKLEQRKRIDKHNKWVEGIVAALHTETKNTKTFRSPASVRL